MVDLNKMYEELGRLALRRDSWMVEAQRLDKIYQEKRTRIAQEENRQRNQPKPPENNRPTKQEKPEKNRMPK